MARKRIATPRPYVALIEKRLIAEFFRAARTHDRTVAQLLRDFMRNYVAQQEAQDYDAWLIATVEQLRASAEAGDLILATDVEARFAARRAATRARHSPPFSG